MKDALASGQQHALVFEDDVSINAVPPEVWRDATAFIKTHPFDIVLLGWGDGDGYRPKLCSRSNNVFGYRHVHMTKCLCTHAVVYSRRFMEYFTKHHATYPGYEIDDFFVDLPNIAMFIIRPEIFDQRDVESTIDDATVERVFFPPVRRQ
jgi:GR25 family glycosyltransferase involved in LPS biosynthesis